MARHREDQFNGATFPVFFNNGSKLLGVQDGKFILVDAAGKSRLEGSLADSASVARIKRSIGATRHPLASNPNSLKPNQILIRFPSTYDFVLVPIHQNFRHTRSRVVVRRQGESIGAGAHNGREIAGLECRAIRDSSQ